MQKHYTKQQLIAAMQAVLPDVDTSRLFIHLDRAGETYTRNVQRNRIEQLTGNPRRVMDYIAGRSNMHWWSAGEIARECNMEPKAVSKVLNDLKLKGFLRSERAGWYNLHPEHH